MEYITLQQAQCGNKVKMPKDVSVLAPMISGSLSKAIQETG